jgi:hypothetical protein
MDRMIRFLFGNARRLRRDEGGQAIIVVAVLGLVLAMFFAVVINVGNLATNRIKMQGAADAAAHTAATWTARGMNIISMFNVAMSHALALVIIIESLDEMYTLTEAGNTAQYPVCGVISAASVWVPPLGAVATACFAAAELVTDFLPTLKTVTDTAQEAKDPLWNVMKALAVAEKAVAYATPYIAVLHAQNVAKANGADWQVGPIGPAVPFPVPGWELGQEGAWFTLPVTDEGGFQELCEKTLKGGHGFALRYTDNERHRWSNEAQQHEDSRGDPITEGGEGYLEQYHSFLQPLWTLLGLGSLLFPTIGWGTTAENSPVVMNAYHSICGGGAVSSYGQNDVLSSSCKVCAGAESGPDGRTHQSDASQFRYMHFVVENQTPNQPDFNARLHVASGSGDSAYPENPNVKILAGGEWVGGAYWDRTPREESGGKPAASSCPPPPGVLQKVSSVSSPFSPRVEYPCGPGNISGSCAPKRYYRKHVYIFKSCRIDLQWDGAGASSPDDKPKPLILKKTPEQDGEPFFRKHLHISMFALATKEKAKPLILGHEYTDPYTSENVQIFKAPEFGGVSIVTFGQARVFNQRSEDLFTQDWKATLTRFDMHRRYGGEFLGGLGDILDKVVLH